MLALIVLVSTLLLIVFFLVRQGQKTGPGDVLYNYINAILSGRTEAAYHCLSSKDKAKQTPAEYQRRHALGSGLLANMIAGQISFVIEKVDIQPDHARLTTTITAPDFRGMASDLLQGLAPATIPERPLEAFVLICRQMSHYLDRYHKDAIPKQTRRETFHLIREARNWRISLESF